MFEKWRVKVRRENVDFDVVWFLLDAPTVPQPGLRCLGQMACGVNVFSPARGHSSNSDFHEKLLPSKPIFNVRLLETGSFPQHMSFVPNILNPSEGHQQLVFDFRSRLKTPNFIANLL